MEIYVVLATYKDGRHNQVTSPVIVTENPAVALTAAFGVEEKGYFLGHNDGVAIFKIVDDAVYPPMPYDPGGHPPPNVVFTRIRSMHNKSGWVESWYSAELEVMYRRVFDATAT